MLLNRGLDAKILIDLLQYTQEKIIFHETIYSPD